MSGRLAKAFITIIITRQCTHVEAVVAGPKSVLVAVELTNHALHRAAAW
jgi:hypothetical protein